MSKKKNKIVLLALFGLVTAKSIFAASILLVAVSAYADGTSALDEIVVTAHRNDLIGEASSATEGVITAKQLENRPLLRPAEVLEEIPGLIISQHSGDGKANQYYLRGFNLDHGTDLATTVMGMPANMPSHAHGQGYSDLQFLIPELIDRIQYRKGPYAADAGDFATAGSASIDYFRKLDSTFAVASAGQNGYRRGLVAGSPQIGGGTLLYALELTGNNGPWQLPESLEKANGMLRYGVGDRNNGWSVAAMAYAAQWNSTDQVPQRAIESGQISRFGNIDPTDGGNTHRNSLSAEWSERGPGRWMRSNAYFMDYSINLWSNFTFCMNDIALYGNCNHGDQFQQTDQRKVYGLNAANTWYGDWGGKATDFTLGFQSRFDHINNGLLLTTARTAWATIRQDQVNEGNISLYGENQTQWLEKFRSIVGLREDVYSFEVASSLVQNSGKVNDHIASPKLALIFGPWDHTEYYFNAGYGFHSNDARGTTTKVNPDFRDTTGYMQPVSPVTPLVRAKGYELGLRSAIIPHLQTNFALWQLDLASELVFAGDAGTTSPSFPSHRTGIEWANYWAPREQLTVDADAAVSRARYTTIDPTIVSGYYIPGSIEKTLSVGAAYDSHADWSGGLRLRYFGPRPLIENNSIRSASSTLVNMQAGYKVNLKTKLTVDVLNVFNRQASDIDYYYTTQLRNEPAPVNDIITHPAEPRSVRLTLRINF